MAAPAAEAATERGKLQKLRRNSTCSNTKKNRILQTAPSKYTSYINDEKGGGGITQGDDVKYVQHSVNITCLFLRAHTYVRVCVF